MEVAARTKTGTAKRYKSRDRRELELIPKVSFLGALYIMQMQNLPMVTISSWLICYLVDIPQLINFTSCTAKFPILTSEMDKTIEICLY
jgi:hypothetical protein